jgi:hypothetical protein
MSKTVSFEAVIDGNEIDTIDPVVSITISNGYSSYAFAAAEIRKIEIRAMRKRAGKSA